MNKNLQELLDAPNEILEAEYKSWVNFIDATARAKIARHIAAIANHGGGYIVFGFEDDLKSSPQPNPFPFNRDDISAIIIKYLDPPPQIELAELNSAIGNTHIVIIIPPHGRTPVCSISDGPHLNGKPQGIRAATYYFRKAGPQSAPIIRASEWQDIIRRCALSERAAILSALGAVLGQAAEPAEKIDHYRMIERWDAAAENRFMDQIKLHERSADLNNHQIFSYLIDTADGQKLEFQELQNELGRINFEIERYVRSGWPLFYVFRGKLSDATWMSDATAWNFHEDFLESSQLLEQRAFGHDLWRAAPNGLLVTVREFWEDTLYDYPSNKFSPGILARTIGELVEHAFALGGKFREPSRVFFRCHWRGLAGRSLHSERGVPFFGTSVAVSNEVISTTECPYAQIQSNLPDIVSQLGSRVLRAFNSHAFSPEWVSSVRPTWPRP